MSNQKFGTSTWDEETGGKRGAQGANGDKKRDAFMRLNDGNNLVRVVTKPHLYLSHKYKEEGDPGFGDKIMCSAPLHKSCVLCDRKDRAKKRWFVGVIDRKTSQYKILDISVLVYDQLKTLNRSEKWGDPSRYDIDIVVNKTAAPANYYSVVPDPPTPLSKEDLELIKKSVNEEELDKKCTPPTPDWVLSKVNTLRAGRGQAALAASSAAPVKAPTNGAAVVDMSDDEDVTFPAVNV